VGDLIAAWPAVKAGLVRNGVPPSLLPAGLYGICDDSVAPDLGLVDKAERLLAGGVRVLQVRVKRTPERKALDAIARIAAACRYHGVVCLVNDRVDWALAVGADGAHVGDDDLPVPEARAALGPSRLLGATARDTLGAQRAAAQGADYVGVGPVFASSTKQLGVPLLGLEGLERVVASSPVPVVAISGITLDTISLVAQAGAYGAAVAADLLLAADIPGRTRSLAAAFEKGLEARSLASR
jgi:thiamine-phosphate pyrophosphorylase